MQTTSNLISQHSALVNKAALMSQYMSKMELLKPLSDLAWDPYKPYAERLPYINVVDALNNEARKAMLMSAATTSPAVALAQKIDELKNASIENKRAVLSSIPIIIVPVAAMYLGVNETELHQFKYSCNGLFGARYMGRQCYSMDELHLIAKNPKWMTEYTTAKTQVEADLPALTTLDDVTFVDHYVACAFTNMTWRDLMATARTSYRSYRPFRLSDLEKIRLAKLKAAA